MYVLDEPSIGLHQRDNLRLISTLRRLRDLGNSVIVVEHDAETIESADHVVDFGPGAGRQGGKVIAQGTPAEVRGNTKSLTGRYLAGSLSIDVPPLRRQPKGWIQLRGAREHNLKSVDVDFPLGCWWRSRGVGRGQVVADQRHVTPGAARQAAGGQRRRRGAHRADRHRGHRQGHRHRPEAIGRTPRSNPPPTPRRST
jgi:excinuclease ABC subunit A